MLVVFRQCLKRLHPMLVADRGEVREQGDRCIVRAQLLLDEGEIEHRAIQQVIPQAATDGLAIQVSRALEVSRLLDPSAERHEFGGMAELGGARLAERPWDDAGEAGERDDIERVVNEHGRQSRGAAGADKVKPDLGDQLAGDVVLALVTQDLILERHQAAAFEAESPQAPRAVQQIEMRQPFKRRTRALEPVARLEQRDVEALAVVGHQDFHVTQGLIKRGQGAGLLGKIAHEKLPHMKAVRADAAHADHERAGAGAAGQACSFGVEKRPALGGASAMASAEISRSKSHGRV